MERKRKIIERKRRGRKIKKLGMKEYEECIASYLKIYQVLKNVFILLN
jgi:hypothetical protein